MTTEAAKVKEALFSQLAGELGRRQQVESFRGCWKRAALAVMNIDQCARGIYYECDDENTRTQLEALCQMTRQVMDFFTVADAELAEVEQRAEGDATPLH